MSGESRVSAAYHNAKQIEIDDKTKLVLFSDCHRGTGTGADNFLKNHKLYYAALSHYYRLDYTYIELGDGDELWEEKNMEDIATEYDHIFGLLATMYREGKLHMIYGNHDMVKKNRRWVKENLTEFRPSNQLESVPLFPNISVEESLLLRYRPTGDEILLLHGHQADFFNDRLWKLGRFMARYLWRPLELLGVSNPMSTATNPKRLDKVEKALSNWGEKRGIAVIAGHTHRPVFPEKGHGLYYNDGSCVRLRYITAIEISKGKLSLVKWEVEASPGGTLCVMKEDIFPPRPLEECFT